MSPEGLHANDEQMTKALIADCKASLADLGYWLERADINPDYLLEDAAEKLNIILAEAKAGELSENALQPELRDVKKKMRALTRSEVKTATSEGCLDMEGIDPHHPPSGIRVRFPEKERKTN